MPARLFDNLDIIEMVMAQAVKDKVEAAYRRDPVAKRRELMDEWARHCATRVGDNVVRIAASR